MAYLFAQIRCRDDTLCQGHPIVLEEYQLQLVTYVWVVVHLFKTTFVKQIREH